MSSHRDFAGPVPERLGIRSSGVAITEAVLRLALVILQMRDFLMLSVGLECAARCCQWDRGWESQLQRVERRSCA